MNKSVSEYFIVAIILVFVVFCVNACFGEPVSTVVVQWQNPPDSNQIPEYAYYKQAWLTQVINNHKPGDIEYILAELELPGVNEYIAAWEAGCDKNSDGAVNLKDYAIFASHYGATIRSQPKPTFATAIGGSVLVTPPPAVNGRPIEFGPIRSTAPDINSQLKAIADKNDPNLLQRAKMEYLKFSIIITEGEK